MAIVRSRAPLRLGLGGGGTDVSPYCDLHGGYVLNATIDRYAYAVIETLDEQIVEFYASDLDLRSRYIGEPQSELPLHAAVYKHMIRVFNNGALLPLRLSTFCDAPPGSGLGSSSTLVVAMIGAFIELLDISLDDYEIAHLAFRIERVECGLLGGRQDQYSATFGGFNFMEFYANDRVVINPLRIKNWIRCEMEASLLLYFTAASRDSARIISDQASSVTSGTHTAMHAMHSMKAEALRMKDSLLRGNFQALVSSVRNGWESKKLSAVSVSNDSIDKTYEAACRAGALAGKVSGAGGGGFMWFFVPTEKRMAVIGKLTERGGFVSNCHFTESGLETWKVR